MFISPAGAYNFEKKIEGSFKPSRSEVIAKNLDQLRMELISILERSGEERFPEELQMHFKKFTQEAINARVLTAEDAREFLARLNSQKELSLSSLQRWIQYDHPVEQHYGSIYED